MAERNYEFRRRLNVVHRPDRRDRDAKAGERELVVENGWRIVMSDAAAAFVVRVAQDLQDYLLVSMGVSVLLVRTGVRAVMAEDQSRAIVLALPGELDGFGDGLSVRRSYRLLVRPGAVVLCGRDERGLAQGCYFLEDLMNLREAPFLLETDVTRAPLFQPRMVHSGWGIDQFPDTHLNAIAHAGMDAVLLFVKGVNTTTTGHLDINDLIDRAASYGLDVYLYSYLESSEHPASPGAEAFYERTYGELMRSCPGARGIVFVGESCEFPSRDPRTKGRLRLSPVPSGGEDDSRPFPGWWPCTDYPEWLDLLKRVIRRANPACDIVFWTYNWGWAPEADRLALIRRLPTDISLQVTFEMFETIVKDGVPTRCVDYTASFEGPGTYFRSEAAAARERGIPLYAMANTAGLTWDIGVIPFEPIPYQWKRRYDALHDAREKWGLRGLMESHHFGWWPSFVSELAKWSYWEPRQDLEAMASRIAERDYGRGAASEVVRTWRIWSDAFRDYVPTDEDQYGPFRIGPSYPLLFPERHVEIPCAAHAHFGNRIVTSPYRSRNPQHLRGEIRLLARLAAEWERGLGGLRRARGASPARKVAALDEISRLGEFILRSVRTTIHVKTWFLLHRELEGAPSDAERRRVLEEMLELGQRELHNAAGAIPLVDADSRLGWEPSMEYMTDRAHLEWKIGELRRVVDERIPEAMSSLGS